MKPVIDSLLDTDLYKFTMWQTMLHRHPETQAEYSFVCRNEPAYPLADLLADVNRELDRLCALSFTADELAYLRGLRFIKSDFVDFLRIFRFQRDFIVARANGAALRSKRRKYSSLTIASTKISKAITCTCGPRVTISSAAPFARATMKSRWKRKMRRKSTKSDLMKRSPRR